jgi:signal peptidase I
MPDRGLAFDEFNSLAVEILGTDHALRFRARGSSMRPFILDNDLVEIHPIESERLKRGDVILCQLDRGRMVLHRIVHVRKTGWVIQGDALSRPDGQVSSQQIVGRATLIYRNGKQTSLDNPLVLLSARLYLVLLPLRRLLRYCLHLIRKITV